MMHIYLAFLAFTTFIAAEQTAPQICVKAQNATNTEITVQFPLSPGEYVYYDSINLAVDNPAIIIDNWHTQEPSVQEYDPATKETRAVIHDHLTLKLSLKTINSVATSPVPHLHINFLTNKAGNVHQRTIPLPMLENETAHTTEPTETATLPNNKPIASHYSLSAIARSLADWAGALGNRITETASLPLKLLLVFLLGILMSFTPCIYPMIPITVGILQAQHKKSFWANTLTAICYTVGLSTTFAVLGLIAAYSGVVFGRILTSPIFVIILVSFLGYLAFSMLGFYDLYVPRFAQRQAAHKSNRNSYLSAFLFGAASGTIASPCVSPGLALLLTLVATLGSTVLGFLLLFVFGLGLSTPLLIIGTFSNSVAFLPRAGMWMVEMKKIFGFLLLGVCLYYLSNILPHLFILVLTTVACGIAGGYYVYRAVSDRKPLRNIHTFIGLALCVASMVVGTRIAQEMLFAHAESPAVWLTDYQQARTTAQANNKLMFIDCWATFCSSCVAINKTLLADKTVLTELANNYVPLKVDGSVATTEPFATVNSIFNITQFPTFLLVDPHTEEVVARFGAELYTMTPAEFIELLKGPR